LNRYNCSSSNNHHNSDRYLLLERFSGLSLILLLLCAACSRQPNLSPLPRGGTILAFGNSLTYGTGVEEKYSYPVVLESLTSHKVVRSGVPGEISADGLVRLKQVVTEVRPSLVVLCHGGNDVLRRIPASRTETNLRSMIGVVRSAGAQVVLVAVPRFGLFPSAWDYYERLADDLKVPVEFDVISDLETDAAMKSDRIHFNRQGYRIMAEAVFSLLKDSGAL
jgi:acyl-CoA thioesterase-1